MPINSPSWNVGLAKYIADFVCATRSATPGLFIGLYFVILIELSLAHLAKSAGFVLLQCLSPIGRSICFSLSIIDCFRDFVFIPRLIQRFLMVSLDRLFSLSMSLRLLP
tara:strand:+ start:13621 stop:13947 length:327 start_codon:yes stop_codon:yes gene_type:complete